MLPDGIAQMSDTGFLDPSGVLLLQPRDLRFQTVSGPLDTPAHHCRAARHDLLGRLNLVSVGRGSFARRGGAVDALARRRLPTACGQGWGRTIV